MSGVSMSDAGDPLFREGARVLVVLLVREPGDIWLLYTLTAIQMVFAGLFFQAV